MNVDMQLQDFQYDLNPQDEISAVQNILHKGSVEDYLENMKAQVFYDFFY